MRKVSPGPGQESVWDYPRPPAVERTGEHVRVELGGVLVAESRRALRVLETSHPPVYYLPLEDFAAGAVEAADGSSFCEFKGTAAYWTLVGGARREVGAAWSYPTPAPPYAALRGHLAVYPGRVDRCTVDGEVVRPQEGGFYGGWVTDRVVGPFKGGLGTTGW